MRTRIHINASSAKISAGNSNFSHKDKEKQQGKTRTSARAVTDFKVSYKCSLKQHTGCPKYDRTWCQCPCHKKEPQV